MMSMVVVDAGKKEEEAEVQRLKEKKEDEQREEKGEGRREKTVLCKIPPGVIEILKPLCVGVEKNMKETSDVGIPAMPVSLKMMLENSTRYELGLLRKAWSNSSNSYSKSQIVILT